MDSTAQISFDISAAAHQAQDPEKKRRSELAKQLYDRYYKPKKHTDSTGGRNNEIFRRA